VAAALEAVEAVPVEVRGEAAAGGGGRAVQGAGAAVLGVACVDGAAEQLQDGREGHGGANGVAVDGWPGRDSWLTRAAFVLGLASQFATFAGLGEFAIAGGADVLVSSVEPVLGCDRADGAVKSDGVVMEDEVSDEAAGLVEGEGDLGADAIALESFVPAFDRRWTADSRERF